jgi:hypothetical protein
MIQMEWLGFLVVAAAMAFFPLVLCRSPQAVMESLYCALLHSSCQFYESLGEKKLQNTRINLNGSEFGQESSSKKPKKA